MFLEVHVDRPLEAHLPVLEDAGVFVLCDPIHRTVEGPVEDDAGCLAAKARIVSTLEGGGGLLAGRRQFGAAVETRPGSRSRPSTSGSARTRRSLAWLVLFELAERNQAA